MSHCSGRKTTLVSMVFKIAVKVTTLIILNFSRIAS